MLRYMTEHKAALMLVRDQHDNLLLAARRHDLNDTGLLGGAVNQDEEPVDAAAREAYEEAHVVVTACHKVPRTSFEELGVTIIKLYVDWLLNEKLLSINAVKWFHVQEGGVFGAVTEVVNAISDRRLTTDVARHAVDRRVHVEVPPIAGFVRTDVLHGAVEPFTGGWEEATAFAVQSYPGHAPTWKVLLKNGAVFDYVPLHGFSQFPRATTLTLSDLAYFNCPAGEVCCQSFEHLKGPVRACFPKGRNEHLWHTGTYLFTVDWFTENESVNVIALESGAIAFVPNHKLLIGAAGLAALPDYQKMRAEWHVD